jgi:hypothetical protein
MAVEAEHTGDGGTGQVDVEDTDACSFVGGIEGKGELGGDRALSDAALAREDEEDVFDLLQSSGNGRICSGHRLTYFLLPCPPFEILSIEETTRKDRSQRTEIDLASSRNTKTMSYALRIIIQSSRGSNASAKRPRSGTKMSSTLV